MVVSQSAPGGKASQSGYQVGTELRIELVKKRLVAER